MANTIEMAKLFQSALDKVLAQALTTGWTEANANRVQYNGGNEVKIAKMTMDGLADYSRASGYDDGDVTLAWETHPFRYDRGRMFNIDTMDVDEANFIPQATTIMNEFVRTQVVPEVDLIRIATMAGFAPVANVVDGTADALEDIKNGIAKIRDAGYDGQLVAHITFDKLSALEREFAKQLSSITFSQAGVNTTVPAIDDVPLIGTQSKKMVDAIEKNASGLYVPTADANDLDILLVGRDVPMGIAKHTAPKIITPEVNQTHDGWKVGYRIYHDLFVEDNKVDAVYAVKKASADELPSG